MALRTSDVDDHNAHKDRNHDHNDDRQPLTIVLPQHYPPSQTPLFNCTYPSPLHSIHIHPNLLSPSETSHCLQLAKAHATSTGCWSRGKDTDRHSAYSTVDFPVDACEPLRDYLLSGEEDEEGGRAGFEGNILGALAGCYGVHVEDLEFLDLFVACYRGQEDDGEERKTAMTMESLAPHRDGSLLSFTIPLSPSSDYTGGGTTFEALRDVPPLPHSNGNDDELRSPRNPILRPGGIIKVRTAGDAVLHSGKILHGGATVQRGERIVLVGFVDVLTTSSTTTDGDGEFGRTKRRLVVRDGVFANACRDWGRRDVAVNRWKRQCAMVNNTQGGEEDGQKDEVVARGGWHLRNNRFIPSRRPQQASSSSLSNGGTELTEGKRYRGSCYNRGFVPAFSSVRRRGDVEYRRRKQLETEDILLRDALMVVVPPDDM